MRFTVRHLVCVASMSGMGLKAWAAKAPTATFGHYSLYQDRVQHDFEKHSLWGVSAVVERGSDLQKRVTLTRLVGVGVFALMAKKKSGGEWWLAVEGPDFAWTEEVGRKDVEKAKRFAAAVNVAARQS